MLVHGRCCSLCPSSAHQPPNPALSCRAEKRERRNGEQKGAGVRGAAQLHVPHALGDGTVPMGLNAFCVLLQLVPDLHRLPNQHTVRVHLPPMKDNAS